MEREERVSINKVNLCLRYFVLLDMSEQCALNHLKLEYNCLKVANSVNILNRSDYYRLQSKLSLIVLNSYTLYYYVPPSLKVKEETQVTL